jgi:hypothetical protein
VSLEQQQEQQQPLSPYRYITPLLYFRLLESFCKLYNSEGVVLSHFLTCKSREFLVLTDFKTFSPDGPTNFSFKFQISKLRVLKKFNTEEFEGVKGSTYVHKIWFPFMTKTAGLDPKNLAGIFFSKFFNSVKIHIG